MEGKQILKKKRKKIVSCFLSMQQKHKDWLSLSGPDSGFFSGCVPVIWEMCTPHKKWKSESGFLLEQPKQGIVRAGKGSSGWSLINQKHKTLLQKTWKQSSSTGENTLKQPGLKKLYRNWYWTENWDEQVPILFLFPVESTNSSFSRIRFPFLLIQLISRPWFHLGVSLNPLQKILFPFQTTNLWVCHYWRLFEYWFNPMNWGGVKGILWEDEIIFAPYVYCWGAKDVPSVLMSLILLTLCILFMLLWFQPITSFPAPDNRSDRD